MFNAFSPPSFPAAAKVPPVTPALPWGERWRRARAKRRFRLLLRRMRRYCKRNYDINSKVIALAVLLEGGISGGIFYGAWENAELYAPSHPVFMLLAPYLSVCVEFIKVPVGLISQMHPSRIKRALAVMGLLVAGTGTAINAVPIVAKMWKPQLAVVQQDTTNLAVAKANQSSFEKDRLAAKDAADRAQGDYKDAQDTRRTASKRDAYAKGTLTELASARNEVAKRETKLNASNKKLAEFDAKKTDGAVRDAEAALRKARQDSTLHWIYASATGAEISSVTDKELAPVMVGAIGLPALVIALASSLLSVLAVSPIQRPKQSARAPESAPQPDLEISEPVWDTMTDFVRQEEEARAAKEAEAKAKAKRLREDAKAKKAFAKIEAARRTGSNDNSSSRKSRPSQKDGDNEATS